ncbi:hypothetical protein HMPREF0290_0560 [Corynebacterium efficiens YS-314]|nr:hypothetical protein HMPREF0290_0560 [Corynebacterium efficiens YS-314]
MSYTQYSLSRGNTGLVISFSRGMYLYRLLNNYYMHEYNPETGGFIM